MKVYVSEKEFDKECKVEVFELTHSRAYIDIYTEKYNSIEGTLQVKFIEQHDAEIKAPLLEEIETLKTENYHLKQVLEFGKSSYASLQEQLELVKQRLVPAPLPEGEYTLHYLSSDRIRKQAKQEVINELLEWADNNKKDVDINPSYDFYYTDTLISYDNLKQKLNEMKGERLICQKN